MNQIVIKSKPTLLRGCRTGNLKKRENVSIQRYDSYIKNHDKQIFIREIVPSKPKSNLYLLFVHGLTFPSIPDFDLPVQGYSITEYLAKRNINCCIFDLGGYGKSDKPKHNHSVDMFQRVQDLKAVYEFLKNNRGAEKIGFIGLSSGCNIISELIANYQINHEFVVFLGPCYLKNKFIETAIKNIRYLKILRAIIGKRNNTYVNFSKKILKNRLFKGEEKCIDEDTFNSFVSKSIDLTCPGKNYLAAPIIPFIDYCLSFSKWEPLYNEEKINCPILLLRGEKDEIACKRSTNKLVDNLKKHNSNVNYISFPEKKHDMHLYKDHHGLFQTIYNFIKLYKRG